jgi:hypothetical protein
LALAVGTVHRTAILAEILISMQFRSRGDYSRVNFSSETLVSFSWQACRLDRVSDSRLREIQVVRVVQLLVCSEVGPRKVVSCNLIGLDADRILN